MLPLPDNYSKLLAVRKSENVTLKPCPFLKPDIKLRNYQSIGVYHLISAPRIILGDATGLGKTLECLAAYAYLKMMNPDLKMLVVASKSALYQWKSESEKFLQGISTQVVASGATKFKRTDPEWEEVLKVGKVTYVNVKGEATRAELTGSKSRRYQFFKFFSEKKDILVINYNTLVEDYEYLMTKFDKYFVVFDEATYFKNTKTLTYRAVKAVADKAARASGLTATILKNRLLEGYAIYSAILPGLFSSEWSFKKRFCRYIYLDRSKKEEKDEKKAKKKKMIPKLIGYKDLAIFRKEIDPYFLGRRKEDVAKELPIIISKEVLLDMLPQQQRAYQDATDGLLKLDSGAEKKLDQLTQLIFCQQISNAPAIVGINAESSKEEELFRLLEDELVDEKIIIYTNFKKGIDRFEGLFAEKGIKMTRITGDENAAARERNKLMFQDPASGTNVIFINRAGSESINLQIASVFIFIDNPWSYGDYLQLIGRAQRIGSEHSSILVLHLTNRGTIDQHVLKKLKEKQGLVSQVFGEATMGELQFEDSFAESLFEAIAKEAKDDVDEGSERM